MNHLKLKLFYSYCHLDDNFRSDMESALSLLNRNKMIDQWSDRQIVPGQKISTEIERELRSADIVTFLVSRDFLNSNPCLEEWKFAKTLAKTSGKKLISVIIRDCSWKDFDDMSDYLALPNDGKAVDSWGSKDSAWKNVYDGFKAVVEDIRSTFLVRDEFLKEISTIEFCSQSHESIQLEDVFVFPRLVASKQFSENEELFTTVEQLTKENKIFIRGDDQSGKTKLCAHVFRHLYEKAQPVLLVNLEEIHTKKARLEVFKEQYQAQFHGDFDLWYAQSDKTIILDNLTRRANSLGHLKIAKEHFQKIVVTTSNDEYSAFFKDEVELTDFQTLRIATFSHSKQELLIKKWFRLHNGPINDASSFLEDGRIDQIERNINEIIINSKILPRYPFFILSILQTYEVFMPQDVKITAYGHCYHTLILAHLIKSGVDRTDKAISACLNFSAHLAYEINKLNPSGTDISFEEFQKFVTKYRKNYLISDAILNRLTAENGILKISKENRSCFVLPYSFYFFLGKYLASNYDDNRELIAEMLQKSYARRNTLTLIFAIHHAPNIELIDEILLHTACAIDEVEPIKLDIHETEVFHSLLSSIPKRILSDRTVTEERKKEREVRDRKEEFETENDVEESASERMNQIYRAQKNSEILSHILRNKTGELKIDKLEEIIEIICDSGLRVIKAFLFDDSDIDEFIRYIEKQFNESQDGEHARLKQDQVIQIEKMVRGAIFVWTMMNIERIVSSVNKPELQGILKNIRDRMKTPAYDLIYYFSALDVANSFDKPQKDQLAELLSRYDKKDMAFMHRVLSLRTQFYINTHKIKAQIKQAISSLLEIEYKP